MCSIKWRHCISHQRYNTFAVWTKWNGARSRRVDFIAGEGSLRRHACGVQWAWRITAGLCHAFPQCCHSNATCAPIANPPNSAQLGGIPYHSQSYIRVRAIVWACGRGQTHTDRHTDAHDHDTFLVVYDSRKDQNSMQTSYRHNRLSVVFNLVLARCNKTSEVNS